MVIWFFSFKSVDVMDDSYRFFSNIQPSLCSMDKSKIFMLY